MSVDLGGLVTISADAHVDEPHDLWYDRMDPDLRDHAPRRIQPDPDGGWNLIVDGQPLGWVDMSPGDADAAERARLAAVAVENRLEMMRKDGIHGEIVFPTIGLYVWGMNHAAAGRAACEIYNDWIVERLGGSPRIRVAGMIPMWDVDMAIAEIERLSGVESVGAMLLPLVGTPNWNMPEWEPLWGALAAAGKAVVMHQGSGHDMVFYRGWGSATANLLATQSMAPRAAALLACGGVLERHPALNVVMVEVNAGWMAWANSTLDYYYEAHRGWSKPRLEQLPSFYIRRQVHATFQHDPVAIHNIPLTGSSGLLWGNDYPHPESTFPNSRAVLAELLACVGPDDAAAIVGGNAARLFGFDTAAIAAAP